MDEHWQIIILIVGIVAALISAWSVIIIGALKTMFKKSFINLDEKINNLSDVGRACQGLEKDLLLLKADLPLAYVRKEDFVRFDVVINTKLDRLRDLIEELRERKNE